MVCSDNVYYDTLKWQAEQHSRSASEVHEFLNANLNQIAEVRLSLEALSMLISRKERNGGEKNRKLEEDEVVEEKNRAKRAEETVRKENVS